MFMSKKILTLAKIVVLLMFIQGIRIILKLSVFCFIEQTLHTETIVSALLMTVMTFAGIIIAKKKGFSLSVFPTNHKATYAIATAFALTLLISTPFITGDSSLYTISLMVYSSVITPVFEELIFRGYVWNKLEEEYRRGLTVYLLTTLLFAVWHLGYVDSIAFRVASDRLPFIMLMKAVTGLCFGVVLGIARYKTKNCYSTILLHGVMNMFGR